MATPHERPQHDGATIGYSVATQGPNGVIHLATSMNHPSLHFEMNEAWILKKDNKDLTPHESVVPGLTVSMAEDYADGKPKATWTIGADKSGRYLLHGTEVWLDKDGKKKYEVTYEHGRKTGAETCWLGGERQWTWDHRTDGTGVWSQFWPGGKKKAESTWRNFRAHGPATRWDRAGKVISQVRFADGAIVK